MYDNLKHVTIYADFHFVDGVEVNSIRSIERSDTEPFFYNARGYRIKEFHADNEFEKRAKELLPIRLRTVGTDEHVPDIEQSIQTKK